MESSFQKISLSLVERTSSRKSRGVSIDGPRTASLGFEEIRRALLIGKSSGACFAVDCCRGAAAAVDWADTSDAGAPVPVAAPVFLRLVAARLRARYRAVRKEARSARSAPI